MLLIELMGRLFISAKVIRFMGLWNHRVSCETRMRSVRGRNLLTAAHICRFDQIKTVHECPGVL